MEAVSILLVTSSYLPIMGGSEIEAQRVSQALIARGHRVQILCPGGPPMPAVSRWTDDCGIPVRAFGGSVPTRFRGHVFALRVAWTVLTDSRRYDLIYFLMPGLQVALGSLAARMSGKPFMMKFSGSNEIRRMKNSLIGRIQLRFVDRWAGAIMVLNPGMMVEAAECGLRQSKLHWMPNPVDLEEFCPVTPLERSGLRTELGIPDQAGIVLFVGRLAPEKGTGFINEEHSARSLLRGPARCWCWWATARAARNCKAWLGICSRKTESGSPAPCLLRLFTSGFRLRMSSRWCRRWKDFPSA